jgi:hypothetical protein
MEFTNPIYRTSLFSARQVLLLSQQAPTRTKRRFSVDLFGQDALLKPPLVPQLPRGRLKEGFHTSPHGNLQP